MDDKSIKEIVYRFLYGGAFYVDVPAKRLASEYRVYFVPGNIFDGGLHGIHISCEQGGVVFWDGERMLNRFTLTQRGFNFEIAEILEDILKKSLERMSAMRNAVEVEDFRNRYIMEH